MQIGKNTRFGHHLASYCVLVCFVDYINLFQVKTDASWLRNNGKKVSFIRAR